MNILAADIGGTKSWLCLSAVDADGKQTVLCEHIYQSDAFANASDLLQHFLQQTSESGLSIDRMCLALPGIISSDGKYAQLTNLDWVLHVEELKEQFSIAEVCFINDFAAAALGVSTLTEADYIVLNKGKSMDDMGDEAKTIKKIKVVTGAGTGLGLAWLSYAQGRYHAHATEGGHIDFAPTTTQQCALLEMLMKQYTHVSYERLLSGEGLQTIYGFLCELSQATQQDTHSLPQPSELSAMADNGDPVAIQSLVLFAEIYAAYIGNLALLFKPAGGIYIAGGIAAKIIPWIQTTEFLEACLGKGRMRQVVANTPIYLITNHRLGLQGALASGSDI